MVICKISRCVCENILRFVDDFSQCEELSVENQKSFRQAKPILSPCKAEGMWAPATGTGKRKIIVLFYIMESFNTGVLSFQNIGFGPGMLARPVISALGKPMHV